MKRIVLIACVATKKPFRTQASNLYDSTLFKLSYAYAQKLQPDAIYILSAEHGLVHADTEIAPYNKTLLFMPSHERKAWAEKVLSELRTRANLAEDEFIFLAGEKYREHLIPHIKKYQTPLKGLGIGRQLKRLKEL
jgi:hypothetical protein